MTSTHLILPIYCIGSVILFAACWLPLFYGMVDNLWLSGLLGIISGIRNRCANPLCAAIPFVLDRIVSGEWVWE